MLAGLERYLDEIPFCPGIQLLMVDRDRILPLHLVQTKGCADVLRDGALDQQRSRFVV